MRWPFGPPHLTLKPSKKTKKQKRNKKKKKTRKTKTNTQKLAFQLSIKIFFFGRVSKISFLQLGPKSAHPRNTIKIGISANFFCTKKHMRNETAICGPKKQNPEIPIIMFLGLFSSLSTTKNTKHCWDPYFYSVLASLKNKRIFKI